MQLAAAFGRGVGLAGQQLGIQVRGLAGAARCAAQLSAVGSPALAEQKVTPRAVNNLTRTQTQGPGPGPTTGNPRPP